MKNLIIAILFACAFVTQAQNTKAVVDTTYFQNKEGEIMQEITAKQILSKKDLFPNPKKIPLTEEKIKILWEEGSFIATNLTTSRIGFRWGILPETSKNETTIFINENGEVDQEIIFGEPEIDFGLVGVLLFLLFTIILFFLALRNERKDRKPKLQNSYVEYADE